MHRNDGNDYNNNDSRNDRYNPPISRILGCFGLNQRTSKKDIFVMFEKFGEIDKVMLMTDKKTGISRGFCFIYYISKDSAIKAKNELNGIYLHGRQIRVDFSITKGILSYPHINHYIYL